MSDTVKNSYLAQSSYDVWHRKTAVSGPYVNGLKTSTFDIQSPILSPGKKIHIMRKPLHNVEQFLCKSNLFRLVKIKHRITCHTYTVTKIDYVIAFRSKNHTAITKRLHVHSNPNTRSTKKWRRFKHDIKPEAAQHRGRYKSWLSDWFKTRKILWTKISLNLTIR